MDRERASHQGDHPTKTRKRMQHRERQAHGKAMRIVQPAQLLKAATVGDVLQMQEEMQEAPGGITVDEETVLVPKTANGNR